jgi:DNA-binding protein H-NS
MSSKKHIEIIKERITQTEKLDNSQKSESMKRVEEWVLEDRAFGTLKEELIKVSIFFEELFSELGIK